MPPIVYCSCQSLVSFHRLQDAIVQGHVECVSELLRQGINPDTLDGNNWTPIHLTLAIIYDNPEVPRSDIIQALLEAGASPNYLSAHFPPTFYLAKAAIKDLTRAVISLLEHGADTEHGLESCANFIRISNVLESNRYPILNALPKSNHTMFYHLVLHSPNVHRYNRSTSIAHVVLYCRKQPKVIVKVMRNLQQFGGNLWSTRPPMKSLDGTGPQFTVVQELRSSPENLNFLSDSERLSLVDQLDELMRTPLGLQSLCRIAIKKHIGRQYWRKARELPLPPDIGNFLLYTEVFENLEEL